MRNLSSSDPRDGASLPFVSIIIPCRNERNHIGECLDSIVRSTYPREAMEVIVADGLSDDGTLEILNGYMEDHPFIRLVSNERQITSTGLNTGVQHARGDVIIRMDAHAAYPPDYVARLVRWLNESGADNVGGVLETVPGADTPIARAIARAISHPLGVGNAYFRIGTTERRWVDTVPFGCYRRDVFDRIGLFDEDLVRNQDAELNHRLVRSGGRILLVPQVRCRYFARTTLRQLWRMYFQYGYFKPLTIRKLGGVVTLRQITPALFVAALALSVAATAAGPLGLLPLAVLSTVYLGVVLPTAVVNGDDWKTRLALCVTFPTVHLAHGTGFLLGALHFLILRRGGAASSQATALSR